MDYKEIQDLIKLVKKNNISELEIERDDFKISIKADGDAQHVVRMPMAAAPQVVAQPVQQVAAAAPAAVEPAAPVEQPSDLVEIKSPMIGTFYRAPGPDKDPFVSVGDSIATGNVICMIEAMKLFNEIEAEMTGKIVKILVEDATPVEFDQPLFLVDPKG